MIEVNIEAGDGGKATKRQICLFNVFGFEIWVDFWNRKFRSKDSKKQKQEEGDGIKETDKKADLFVLWKYEINLWLLFEAQINFENISNNKLVNNIKAGGTDKKTDVFYFLPELDILSSF